MPPFNVPKTLFRRAKETISDLIVTKCKAIEDKYATSLKLTYDIPDCTASVQLLHDALLDFIPPPMWNFVCEAALSSHDNLKYKIRDGRILYGVLINENITSLKVRGEENQTEQFRIEPLAHVIPSLKNLIKLDLRAVHSNDLIVALINTCEKLEDITLPYTTSEDAFRCLVTKCSKLRVISHSHGNQSKDNLLLAITSLPNLEYLKYEGVSGVLSEAKDLGPLKLRYIKESDATPDKILPAVTLCPNLRELRLGFLLNDNSSAIFDILTASNLKLKILDLYQATLTNASAEKFFIAKGSHLTDLCIYMCDVSTELLNFIKFLGISCKNLETLYLCGLCRPWGTDRKHYLYNVSGNSSFNNLKSISVHLMSKGGPDVIDKDREMIALLIANSPSLEKITLEMWKWTKGYPSGNEIEQMFCSERIKNVSYLSFASYALPKSTVRYFLANAPNLTYFTVPFGAGESVIALVERLRIRAIAKNLNITFEMDTEFEIYDSDNENYEEDLSEEESFEDNEVESDESDESFHFVDEDKI